MQNKKEKNEDSLILKIIILDRMRKERFVGNYSGEVFMCWTYKWLVRNKVITENWSFNYV